MLTEHTLNIQVFQQGMICLIKLILIIKLSTSYIPDEKKKVKSLQIRNIKFRSWKKVTDEKKKYD